MELLLNSLTGTLYVLPGLLSDIILGHTKTFAELPCSEGSVIAESTLLFLQTNPVTVLTSIGCKVILKWFSEHQPDYYLWHEMPFAMLQVQAHYHYLAVYTAV